MLMSSGTTASPFACVRTHASHIRSDSMQLPHPSPSTAVDCGPLSGIENGYVRYSTNGTTLGNNVTYGCNPGYQLSMPLTRTCEVDGLWTNATLPVCSGTMQLNTHHEATLMMLYNTPSIYTDLATYVRFPVFSCDVSCSVKSSQWCR